MPAATAATDAAPDDVAVTAPLKSLSAQQRAVIILRYLDDLSLEQTALALHMSTSTARTHQARALARLRSTGMVDSEEDEFRR